MDNILKHEIFRIDNFFFISCINLDQTVHIEKNNNNNLQYEQR